MLILTRRPNETLMIGAEITGVNELAGAICGNEMAIGMVLPAGIGAGALEGDHAGMLAQRAIRVDLVADDGAAVVIGDQYVLARGIHQGLSDVALDAWHSDVESSLEEVSSVG